MDDMNLGEQPIAKILEEYGLKTHDLVVASEVQMTHKMVQRAMKGRRLTANTKNIVIPITEYIHIRRFTSDFLAVSLKKANISDFL